MAALSHTPYAQFPGPIEVAGVSGSNLEQIRLSQDTILSIAQTGPNEA